VTRLPPLASCVLALAAIPVAVRAEIDPSKYAAPVKVACVGDSITQGHGAGGQPWPAQVGRLLGEAWEVKNYGISGTTLMNSGDSPYQKQNAFAAAKASQPDVVVIMLGTNDTKPQNWRNVEADYRKDYADLVQQFAELPSKPRIFLCYPPYIAKGGNWGINERDTKAQIPLIAALAKDKGLEVIDVHAALEGKDALIPDNVHPNAGGQAAIAGAIYTALTGKAVDTAAQ
jgi:lysophospholipase L1-like esterase